MVNGITTFGTASFNCLAQSSGSQPLIKPTAVSIAGLVKACCQATVWGIGVNSASVAKTTTTSTPRMRPKIKPKKRSVKLNPAERIIFCTTPPSRPQAMSVKTNRIKKLAPRLTSSSRWKLDSHSKER